MSPREDALRVVEPQPLADETTPLLRESPDQQNGSLEAQAEQEQREHDVGTVPIAETPSTRRLLLTMSSLWTSTFFAALDGTIVATLSRPISAEFESSTLFTWVASGYLIGNAAFQPLSGKLTDIYGRRAGLIFASTFFALGTLLCGLAQEEWVIILGRIVAGAGGGCLNTISTFVASDLIPLRRRGVWQGIGNVVYGTGMGLGGVVGGAINDNLGWRYAFYMQVPFIIVAGIIAVVLVKVPIKETDENKLRRVDFLGALCLVTALVLLLLGLSSGGNLVPWNHPLVYVSLPFSGVALVFFVLVEDKFAVEPIIPVRLLLNRSVAATCLTNWFLTMAAFGILFFVPIYFQAVLGASTFEAGLRLTPQSVGTALGSLGSGFIMRAFGRYIEWNVIIQLMSVAACAAVLGTFNVTIAPAVPFVLLFLQGLSYGSMLTISLIALIAAVDHKHQAVITSASYAFRSTGSAIGVATCSALYQNLLRKGLWQRFGSRPDAAKIIERIRNLVEATHDLPEGWHDGVLSAYVDALRGVWVLVLGFAILAAISSFFMRQYKLYSSLDRK